MLLSIIFAELLISIRIFFGISISGFMFWHFPYSISCLYFYWSLFQYLFMPLLSFVKRFTVLILHSKSWILSNLLSQGIIAMELIIFEKIYCLDFSCCMYFYDGTWASGVGSSIAHFGIDPCHYFVELVFESPFASNWAWQVLV